MYHYSCSGRCQHVRNEIYCLTWLRYVRNLGDMDALLTYMRREGLNQREFAELVGCAPSYIALVKAGLRKFGLPMAMQIEQRTGGKLRAVDLRPDLAHLLTRPDSESA